MKGGTRNAECGVPNLRLLALDLNHKGFAVIPQFASPSTVEELKEAVAGVSGGHASAGIRNLVRLCQPVADFVSSRLVIDQLATFTGVPPFAVRGILFDKTPDANWLVAWHQDLTIAVRERRDVTSFGPWSVKEGIPHVQPPAELLACMVTLRLHLDDCDARNGALRVLPGSHCHGKLSRSEIAEWRIQTPEHVCEARAGDALVMRPLLLHASSPAEPPHRRRVIHIEFASHDLPEGLEWFERVGA